MSLFWLDHYNEQLKRKKYRFSAVFNLLQTEEKSSRPSMHSNGIVTGLGGYSELFVPAAVVPAEQHFTLMRKYWE